MTLKGHYAPVSKHVRHGVVIYVSLVSHPGPILPRFRAFCTLKVTFSHPTPIRAKLSGCFPWSRPVMLGCAESEHPRLTYGEITFEEFQPMSSQFHQRHRQTDGRTDRRHAIARRLRFARSASRGRNNTIQGAWPPRPKFFLVMAK